MGPGTGTPKALDSSWGKPHMGGWGTPDGARLAGSCRSRPTGESAGLEVSAPRGPWSVASAQRIRIRPRSRRCPSGKRTSGAPRRGGRRRGLLSRRPHCGSEAGGSATSRPRGHSGSASSRHLMATVNGRGPGREFGERRPLKVVVVGDGGCGKTSLLMVHAKDDFPEQYVPSVFEKYTTSVTVGRKEVTLHLYDTAGQEDYDRLRPLSYQNTDVVLICYDVMNATSFENVLVKWAQEVNHFCQRIPAILVGCKTDLRKDREHLRKLRSAQQEPITYKQGEEACHRMNAAAYLECSAKFRENVEAVFQEAARVALGAIKKAKQHKKNRPCNLV